MLAELLQQRGPAANPAGQAGLAAFIALFYGVLCVVIVVTLVMQVLLCVAQMKTLELCAPRNRAMEPGMVWLVFVPFLNIVWAS